MSYKTVSEKKKKKDHSHRAIAHVIIPNHCGIGGGDEQEYKDCMHVLTTTDDRPRIINHYMDWNLSRNCTCTSNIVTILVSPRSQLKSETKAFVVTSLLLHSISVVCQRFFQLR